MAEQKKRHRRSKYEMDKYLKPIYCKKCGKKLLRAAFYQCEVWCKCGAKHKVTAEEVTVL